MQFRKVSYPLFCVPPVIGSHPILTDAPRTFYVFYVTLNIRAWKVDSITKVPVIAAACILLYMCIYIVFGQQETAIQSPIHV